MKNITFAVVFCTISIIVPWVLGDSCYQDIVPEILIKKDNHHCKKIGCLVSVKYDTPPSNKIPNCEKWLTLDARYFNRITGNAFKYVLIDGLEIDHGEKVLFDKDSLNGLPALRSLKIHTRSYVVSRDFDFDPEVFKAVKDIIHFDYPFYDNDQMNKILKIFTKLEELTVLGGPAYIDRKTFLNASPSIKRVRFITPTFMNIHSHTFYPLHGLTELEFTNASIKFMEPGVFDGLDNLKNLTIWFDSSFNATIPKYFLDPVRNLETLAIKKFHSTDSDRKVNIENDAFFGLTVKNLDMRQIFLNAISSEVFNGLTVENLHLRVNDYASITYQAFSKSIITNLYFWNAAPMRYPDLQLIQLWGLQDNISLQLENDSSVSSPYQ